MKLSLITSSLIALSGAAPVFQGRTEPADLRSPVHILKRASEPAVEAPTLEARFRAHASSSPKSGQGFKREELEIVDESEPAVEAPTLEARFRAHASSSPKSGQGFKREESEPAVEAPILEARFRAHASSSPKSGQGFKREELEIVDDSEPAVEAPTLEARFRAHASSSPKSGQGFKREVEERGNQQPGNWQWNNDKSSENSQNTESQTANVQINSGKPIPVPMGQLFVMNSNGPINTLTTDKGNCKAIQADVDSAAAFGAGFPFNSDDSSANSVITKVQLFLWCLPGAFDPTVIQAPAA